MRYCSKSWPSPSPPLGRRLRPERIATPSSVWEGMWSRAGRGIISSSVRGHPSAIQAKFSAARGPFPSNAAFASELRTMTPPPECVMHEMSTNDLRHEACKSGMMTLRASGVRKVINHVTTPDEVIKVSVADEVAVEA